MINNSQRIAPVPVLRGFGMPRFSTPMQMPAAHADPLPLDAFVRLNMLYGSPAPFTTQAFSCMISKETSDRKGEPRDEHRSGIPADAGYFLLIAVGVFLYRKKAVTEVTSRQLSGLITNICNPALMIASVFSDEMPATRQDILLTAGIAAGTYVFAIAAGILVPRLLRVEPQERKYYHMMMVYGNTGFIGIPLVSALLGEGAVIYVTVFNFSLMC